jgi:mannose-1-phosphate guanylyltransferase
MNQHEPHDAIKTESPLWAIVLAAGEGRRLASVTKHLYGEEIPKQFAALGGGDETLLQQTMDRIGRVVPPHRTVVVVAADRLGLAESQLASYAGVQIVAQPKNIGTGPGLMLPLSLIKAQCPEATVVVTPSDHYVPGTNQFVTALHRAVDVTRHAPAGIALLGADAERPVTDLGWIVPKNVGDVSAAQDDETPVVDLVDRFVEKPVMAVAKELFQQGGLWNTLVLVGSVESFWNQARRRMPRQTSLFNQYVATMQLNSGHPNAQANDLLTLLYESMPPADLSRAILQKARGLAVIRLKQSGWCDCGTPERLLTCIDDKVAHRPQLLQAILNSIHADGGLRPASIGHST